MKDDGARYWFFGKAVKDYIIMIEKTEFTYAEIQEIIESSVILNMANDITWYLMEDWVRFMDSHLCDREESKCDPDAYSKPVHFLRPMQFYLFDPTWGMVQEFLHKNTTNYYYEKLMIFEDFDDFFPIITKDRFENPADFSLDFFAIPKEKRDRPLRFTDEFED